MSVAEEVCSPHKNQKVVRDGRGGGGGRGVGENGRLSSLRGTSLMTLLPLTS